MSICVHLQVLSCRVHNAEQKMQQAAVVTSWDSSEDEHTTNPNGVARASRAMELVVGYKAGQEDNIAEPGRIEWLLHLETMQLYATTPRSI